MAKKKATVKKKIPNLSAMTGPVGPSISTAKTGQIGPDLIGANIGKAQQLDALEALPSQVTDKLRKKAKERMAQAQGSVAAQSPSKTDIIPDGTFKNADGELVVGDMKKFRKATVKKKK